MFLKDIPESIRYFRYPAAELIEKIFKAFILALKPLVRFFPRARLKNGRTIMSKRECEAKVLEIDLDSKGVTEGLIEEEVERDFIGGFGVGVKLAYDLIEPKTDPFDPRNPIILSAGVLGGTRAPGSSRFCAITKYPLTGAVAMGNGGMRFSPKLRAAGFEHMIIRGKAKRPTIIKVYDDKVEFLDAGNLWGKDIYETTDSLWERYGKEWSVIAIGRSGENLVKISLALVDKIATIGKGGLGAVMGSKNLKAIVVNGSHDVPVSDPTRFEKAVEGIHQHVKALPNRDRLIKLGIFEAWDSWWGEGLPIKGGTEYLPKEKATELYGPKVYLEKVKKGRAACPSCPLPEKEIMEVKEGEFKGLTTFAANFAGRAANYGIRCGVGSYDRVLKVLDVSNRLGICSHDFSSLFDFAVELFEKGRITREDTNGIELRRDFETTLKLVEMTALREGFGDIMAEGYNGFFEKFGEDLKEETLQAKGMGMVFDPRINHLGTKTFMMVINPRGGHHQGGTTPGEFPGKTIEDFRAWCERTGVPPDAMERIFWHPMKINMGRLTKHSHDFYAVQNSLGLCSTVRISNLYTLDKCSEVYSSIKGIEMNPPDMKKAAERIWSLYRMVNVREGFDRKDDSFPKKWLVPMKGGEGKRPLPLTDYFETRHLTWEDLQNLLDDYYDECGWDKTRGIPTREKLEDLGLARVIVDLRE